MSEQNLKETKLHGSFFFPFQIYKEILEEGKTLTCLHCHPEFEIIYIKEGKGYLQYNDIRSEINSGDIIIITPEALHNANGYSGIGFSNIAMVFNLELLTTKIMDSATTQFFLPLMNENNFPMIKFNSEKPFYKDFLKEFLLLDEIWNNKNFCYQLEIKNSLLKLFVLMYKNNLISVKNNAKDLEKNNSLLKSIVKYISENFYLDLTMDHIALNLNYNKFYISRFFKEKTGMTCFEYINICRVNNAAKLLKESNKSITQISSDSGFNNVSYFTKTFKKFFNVTPSFYKINKII